MKACTYLQRRNGIYYFRLAIPLSLVDVFKRKELYCSLHTRDHYEAKQKCFVLLEASRGLFHMVEKEYLTSDEINSLARQMMKECLERYHQWNESIKTKNRFKYIPSHKREEHPEAPTEEYIVDLITRPNEGDRSINDPLFDMTNYVLKQSNIQLSTSVPSYKDLASQLYKVREFVERLVHERCYEGNHSPKIEAPFNTNSNDDSSLLTSKVHQEFLQHATFRESARRKHVQAFCIWSQVVGDKLMSQVVKKDARDFREAIQKVPAS